MRVMRVVKYKGIPGAEITAPRRHTQRTLTIHRWIDVGKAGKADSQHNFVYIVVPEIVDHTSPLSDTGRQWSG